MNIFHWVANKNSLVAACLISLSVQQTCANAASESAPAGLVKTAEPKQAQVEQSVCKKVSNRPCIALVLGGGGARGGAHVGVLKALNAHKVPVDLVVGTSIGAFVGGLYASGQTPDQIEQRFVEMDWLSGYQDDLERRRLPVRRKRQVDTFPLQVDIGFDGRTLKMPRGFIQGQGMKQLVLGALGNYARFQHFDDLPIPYRAIAADAETGQQIVISSGDLATAMQASMSLPGIVRPIEKDGQLRVDGGIVNNLPISVAKELGAEVVIAVDIGAPHLNKEQLDNSLNILLQLTHFLTDKNVAEQKALLTENDILLVPPITEVGMLSFDKTQETVALGYEVADRALAKHPLSLIHELSVDELTQNTLAKNQPATAQARNAHSNANRLGKEITVDNIVLDNRTRLSDDYILHRMRIEEGNAYTASDLQAATERLYGQGTIARINSTLDRKITGNTLNLQVDEKEWGPGYLDFKLSLEDDFRSFSRYQFGASYRYTNLSPYGAEWYSTAEIGTEKRVTSELYWPIKTSGFFGFTQGRYERNTVDYRLDDVDYGELILEKGQADIGIGWDAIDTLEIKALGLYQHLKAELPDVLALDRDLDEVTSSQVGTAFEINVDGLDDESFPTRGWKLRSRIERTHDEYQGFEEYVTKADVEINGVLSFERHALRGLYRHQSFISDDALALLTAFELGGFLNLSGLPSGSMVGRHVRFASAVYTYELVENDFGAFRLPLYLGVSLERGNVWQEQDDIDFDDTLGAGSVFVGWDGILGPSYLAYGRTERGESSVYFFVGVTF